MPKFVKGVILSLAIAVAAPLALQGCGDIQKVFNTASEKSKQNTPREDLKVTLATWKIIVTAIDEAFDKKLIDPRSSEGMKLAAAVAQVNAALSAWTKNPDNVTYRDLAKGAIEVAKGIYLEARK